ncbi:MAG: DNA topoisomerase 3 [Blastocatellia bacterium]
MKLVIAEKPSVAKEIATVLGANIRKDGYFEGNGYLVSWAVGHLIELAEPHHYDESLKQWTLESLPIIPDKFKYVVNSRTAAQFKVLRSLINDDKVQSLIAATDSGREGQLIAELIFLSTNCRKPIERLWISSLTEKDIRDGFNNLKPNSFYDGLTKSAHCRQQSDWLVGMSGSRAFSIKASQNDSGIREVFSLGRVQTPTLAILVQREEEIKNFVPSEYFQVIATFASNNTSSDDKSGVYQGLWISRDEGNSSHIDDKQKADAIVAKVSNQIGIVEKVETKLIKEKAPLLFDLTSLQRVANNKYGFTAQKTLDIAQSLYEAKFITYPRTDSQHLSTTLAQQIKGHLLACNVAPYQQFVSQILSSQIKLTSRHISDKHIRDHHAIIPTTNVIDFNSLNDNEQKIYDLIARRFLCMFYPDAEIERTMIITNVLNEVFITRGSRTIKMGWQVIEVPLKNQIASKSKSDNKNSSSKNGSSNSDNDNDDIDDENGSNSIGVEQEQNELPLLKENQKVKTIKVESLSKWTKSPPRFTDAGILSAMEGCGREIDDEKLRMAMKDKGLGTPATRANIIELLLEKAYAIREKKTLKPTMKGICLINLLPNELLKSPELTANWEQKLLEIERGNYSAAVFMDEVKQMVRDLVKDIASSDIGKEIAAEMAASGEHIPCPKCSTFNSANSANNGSNISNNANRKGVLKRIKTEKGNFLVCSLGKDNCGYLSDIPRTRKQAKALITNKCPNCKGTMRLYLPKEKGKSPALYCVVEGCRGVLWFNDKGALVAPKNNNVNGDKPQEMGEPCTKCSKPTVKRGPYKGRNGKQSYFFGCTGYGKGCDAPAIWIN